MIEHSDYYRDYMTQKALDKKASLMAEALMQQMRIPPHDSALVLFCGNETDKTNRDAVRSWVRGKLCCPSCAKQCSISQLEAEFAQYIAKKTNQDWYF